MMTLLNLGSPDLSAAVAILKALLAGEVSREAVSVWCHEQSYRVGMPCWPHILVKYVDTGFDKRRESLARHVFNNLLKVNATVDNGPNQEPYFLRSYDLQMMLDQLQSDFEPHRWKSLVEMPLEDIGKNRWRDAWLVGFHFPTSVVWPPGLWSYRWEEDIPTYGEYCYFYFQGHPFSLARSLDDSTRSKELHLQLLSEKSVVTVASELVVALVKELGLSWTDVGEVSPSVFPVERYGLYRYDDNGGEYLMERFNNFFTAEMTRQMYEDRGHKQIYYLKRETEPVPS